MTRSSCSPESRYRRARFLPLLLTIAAAAVAVAPIGAQGRRDPAALRTEAEQRFEVLPTLRGMVLRPRAGGAVRAIEISGGAIAVDGQLVTGAELRERLGAESDLVLQLSYLDDTERRAWFATPAADGVSGTPPAAPPPPAAAQPPTPPSPPAPPDSRRPSRSPRSDRQRDRVRFGGSITVADGEVVTGDVIVVGGTARIFGEVTGDVVVVGGRLELGPQSRVGNDAVVVGSGLQRDPGARIGGETHEIAVGPLNIDWPGRGPLTDWWSRGAFGPAFSLFATLVRIGVVCLLAALAMLFARGYIDRIAERAVAEPLKAGAIGFLVHILFVPVTIVIVVLCAVTIIGIPLLLLIPFAVLGLIVLALAGFTAVASHVGRLVAARFNLFGYGPIATTVLGVAVVTAPVILGRLVGLAGGPLWLLSVGLLAAGFVVEFAAWTVGIGAVALSRFSRGYTDGGAVTGPAGPAASGPLGPRATDSVSPA